jgi:hypothetical protein
MGMYRCPDDPYASCYVKVIDGPNAPMPSCRLLEQEHLPGELLNSCGHEGAPIYPKRDNNLFGANSISKFQL